MVTPGQQITSSQLLAELTSSELIHQSQTAGLEADLLSWQVAYQGVDEKLAKQRQVKLRQLESATAKQAGFHRQLDQLRIQAPLAGTVLDINDQIQSGQWLKAGEALMIVADTSSYTVEAFVNEQDIMKILANAKATFYPENSDLPPLTCRLQNIDDGSISNMPDLLASNYGGPIAVRVDQNQKLLPETAQYRIQLKVEDHLVSSVLSPSILRGTLKLETDHASLAGDIWRRSLAAILKESGF
jgi:putative peptide zinc metalloprotease protein